MPIERTRIVDVSYAGSQLGLVQNWRILNASATARIEGVEYSEEVEQDHNDNGNLFCDVDSFCTLLDEAGINY